jgi:hypothetical protein
LAEKVDKGEMTVAEARARYAQIRYQVEQSYDAHRAANAQAAVLSALPPLQSYLLPIYQAPASQP